MGLILKVLKWIFIGLIGLIALIAAIPFAGTLIDGIGAKERSAWLQENSIFQGDEMTSAQLSFSPEFYENQVFLFGEVHGFAPPQDVDLTLLKHLNQQTGLRIYLAELDPAQAIAFNHYLESGNDTFARQVFDLWAEENAQWANKEFFEKLSKIREYNLSLTADKRIRFVGVDGLHNLDFAKSIADFDWPVSNLPWSKQVFSLNSDMLAQALSREAEKTSRYSSIMANIEIAINRPGFASEKFYGLWGIFHSYKSLANGTTKPLAHRLEGIPLLEGKVASLIAINGQKSFAMIPSKAMPSPLQGPNGEEFVIIPMGSDNPYFHYVSGLKDLSLAANGSAISLFKIDGKNSPYTVSKKLINYSGIFALAQPINLDGSASEAIDYVVYFEGATPLTPWQGEAHDFRQPSAAP